MSNFDEFFLSLSNEQKQKLMESIMNSSNVEENKPKKTTRAKKTTKTVKPKTVKQNNKEEAVSSSNPLVVVNEDFTVTKSQNSDNRKTPVRFKRNEWHDSGDEFKEIITPQEKITPRNRKPPEKVTLECHICGKEFKQNSSNVFGEFHRCNRCTGR
jgi:hypothetical protein